MDNEQHHQELVKCVVVGDTAVGKTRLICARACNKQLSLSQLLTTHVPTVWAIDQYRIYKDVLERSWEIVDGVNVSLRLWDTFGDHEKDRRFAYGRSDVVLLCFSLASHKSLMNCKAMWYPEIRKFCPQTPVILVGCKNDLRYMYRDESYLEFFRERSPFLRAIRKSDLVMPDQARSIARELGVTYYETSVLTYYGVNEAFENAIRAALIARRQQRFWMTNLKKVQRPLLQTPYCPPKPMPRQVQVCASTFDDALRWLLTQQPLTDVVFLAGSACITAHRFMLAAASPSLQKLLCMDLTGELSTRSASESSMVSTFGEATSGDFNEDTEFLIRVEKPSRGTGVWEQLKRRSSCQVLVGNTAKDSWQDSLRICASKELNHPAFSSIRIQQYEDVDAQGRKVTSMQTIITLSKLVTPQAMQQCISFLYTGSIDSKFTQLQCLPIGLLLEIRQAAEFIDLPELLVFVSNIQSHEAFLNPELKQRYKQAVRNRLRELCLGQGLFADVMFQLEDGYLPAHRPLLMARCDMMRAMFSGDFREGSAKVILFPGVKCDTFRTLLCYLYCDDIGPVQPARCVDLLELANRLCLPRLLNLIEKRVVGELQRMSTCGGTVGTTVVTIPSIIAGMESGDGTPGGVNVAVLPPPSSSPSAAAASADTSADLVLEICLKLLEPGKLHNADQLADWCMNHLCCNYNKLCKMSPKLLRGLHPDNQDYLMENRWPPIWYLKDSDYYDRCMSEREREERMLFKRSSSSGGCLCFPGGGGNRNVGGNNGTNSVTAQTPPAPDAIVAPPSSA